MSLDFCGLDSLKIKFSLSIYSGADHRLERHPRQHRSSLIQAVFKDCPQAMRCGQVREASYEEAELALFLLDREHRASPGGDKRGRERIRLLSSNDDHHRFLPGFHFNDPLLRRRLHPP